jgi:hypothetical protein
MGFSKFSVNKLLENLENTIDKFPENLENTIDKLLETRRIPSTSYWKPGEYQRQVTGNPENTINKLLWYSPGFQ